MTKKDTRPKRTSSKPTKPASETEHRAPSGRGGAAMGRTVGLPFGGARPRKRRGSTKTSGETKTKS